MRRARKLAASSAAIAVIALPVAATTNEGGPDPVNLDPSTTTEPTPPPPPPTDPKVAELEAKLAREKAQNRRLRRRNYKLRIRVRRVWRPTVQYAFTLAAAIYGVPRWQLSNVGWCESKYDPFAENGRYLGVMQLGWRPFGLSPYDPIANVLSAAKTVHDDRSWRQWECKP